MGFFKTTSEQRDKWVKKQQKDALDKIRSS